MKAYFYNIADNPLKLNKTLGVSLEKNIKLLKVTSYLTLDFVLTNYENENYVYIPDFGRYYFITDIEIKNNGLFRISLKEDVLMSYKDVLTNNENHVIKSSLPIGENINYVGKFEKTTLTQDIENPFKNAISDVLITIKG